LHSKKGLAQGSMCDASLDVSKDWARTRAKRKHAGPSAFLQMSHITSLPTFATTEHNEINDARAMPASPRALLPCGSLLSNTIERTHILAEIFRRGEKGEFLPRTEIRHRIRLVVVLAPFSIGTCVTGIWFDHG
jgi:hypothetical protein